MKLLREADAWPIARANAKALQEQQQNSEATKERRVLNKRLAEKLVNGWSAYEYREKLDVELQQALDGQHDGKFDVNAPKYARQITVKPQSFGADANSAAAATEQRTKQRLAQFQSVKLNGEPK